MKFFFLAILCGFFGLEIQAQARNDWQKYYEIFLNQSDVDEETGQDIYEALSEHSERLINLNTATREELEALKFLSDEQIEGIIEYVYKYKPVRTLSELVLVEPLDAVRRDLLTCFLTIENNEEEKFPTLRQILRYGRHQLSATLKAPLYTRAGDREGFLGYRYKHQLRYTFHYGESLKAGFTAVQDAGEPFFKDRNSWGYDYYSFYLSLKNLKWLKHLVVGRYRLKFGMGLVLNNDFNFGKAMMLTNLAPRNNPIRTHSSTSSANYLYGSAAQLSLSKDIQLALFGSWRTIDATLSKDGQSITTLLKTGLHRTRSEMNRKNDAAQWLAGTHLRFFRNGFHAGITAYATGFDKPLNPNRRQLFRLFYPTGKSFYNLGADYGYISRRFTFSGETATGDHGSWATINSAAISFGSTFSLTLLQRFYGYRFYTLFGNTFSEGGRVQNESGIYCGFQWKPAKTLTLSGYTDYAYFPWARYRVGTGSWASDNLLAASYQKKRFTFAARYRLHLRHKDLSENHLRLTDLEQRGKLSASYDTRNWGTRTSLDMAFHRFTDNSFGWLLMQTAHYTFARAQLFGSLACFHTQDYLSRIYIYERGLLYTFSFPMFYGKGFHYSLGLRYDLTHTLILMAKLSGTVYSDRDHISSGLTRIDSNAQNDVEMQLRWKF